MTAARQRYDVSRSQRDQVGITLIENLSHSAGTKGSEFEAKTWCGTDWPSRHFILKGSSGGVVSFEFPISFANYSFLFCTGPLLRVGWPSEKHREEQSDEV